MFGKNHFRLLWNVLFPPRCIFCRKWMPLTSLDRVCMDCRNHIPYCMSYARCIRCGKPVDDGAKKCSFCQVYRDLPFERICSAYVYEGKVKEAFKRFKREKYQGYAQEFGEYLKAVVEYDCKGIKFDAVISVPPRPERMKKEGYDQARCLAKELADRMEVVYLESVMRQKEKRAKQSGLGRAARMKNAKGNYAVRKPEAVAGKTVLLVDDICTTRATFLECAKMLKEAGAAAVYCASGATTI